MGYDVILYSGWMQHDPCDHCGAGEAFRAGVDSIAMAHWAGSTPARQRRAYRVDFVDCLTYAADGVDMLGDPTAEGFDGVWAPDWPVCIARCERLLHLAEAAGDEYTLTRGPNLLALLRLGRTTPGAVVSWSF